MTEQDSINEIFFKFLMQYQFEEQDLDYTLLDKHKVTLQTLANIGNSGISLFDISKRQIVILGLIASILIFIAALLEMFGIIQQVSLIGGLFGLPIFVYEMSVAIWLIIKGFNTDYWLE